jgi:Na+-translocating ferredoxin:NAD+ oxidoreductase RnfC subunit
MENNIQNQYAAYAQMASIIKQSPLMTCECGSTYWREVYVVRKVNGILVGSKKPYEAYPQNVLICDKCGKICDDYKKDIEVENENKPMIKL